MFIWSESNYMFLFYLCLLLLSITLFVCHLLSHCKFSEGVVSFYICWFFYPHVCLCIAWSLVFTEKSVYGKINLVLSVISIISILVNILQMIWGYDTSFAVFQPVFSSVSLSDRHFTP